MTPRLCSKYAVDGAEIMLVDGNRLDSRDGSFRVEVRVAGRAVGEVTS